MKKTTGLNALLLIINCSIIAFHYNDRLDIVAEQTQSAEMWESAQEARLKTFSDNYPMLSNDVYKKAVKEGLQYADDDKILKQYWIDKRTEWEEKSAALDLVALKDMNIGLSKQECFTKYGQPKSITAYEFYTLYEFYTDDGVSIKIYVETQTKKSFYVIYINTDKPAPISIPKGNTYGHFHSTKGGRYYLSVWINSKIGLILSDRTN